jgi:hypothetical protein
MSQRATFDTFREMIEQSGLTYVATVSDKQYRDTLSLLGPFPGMWIMVSRMPADDLVQNLRQSPARTL